MVQVKLSPAQIEWIAKACEVASGNDDRFLEDDVRRLLAQALRAMGRPREAASIDLESPSATSSERVDQERSNGDEPEN